MCSSCICVIKSIMLPQGVLRLTALLKGEGCSVCSEYAVLFLCLCNFVSKTLHKATTRNGVYQGIGRPQHTPSQTDTVVRFVQEHVAVFCVCVI